LSYVSIYKPVNDRITKLSTDNSNEVIGLLIGNLINDTLVIEDSITGEFSGEPHRVVLHPQTVAKIADDLVKGRLKGNIVGWYHSHTEDGIFFSQTDVETQQKLQQFSSLTVGMVVDARNGEVGFFRLDSSGKPVRVPEDKVKVFSRRSEAASIKEPSTIQAGKPRPRIRGPVPIKLILGIILVALVISLSILGIQTLSTRPVPSRAMIYHIPVGNALVGSSISIIANSTGIKNMTLFYSKDGEPFKAVEMNLTAPGQFQATIPSYEVTGNISYYLEGATDAGGNIASDMFHVLVADFNLTPANQTVTVYRNATIPYTTFLSLVSINGFSDSVKISTSGEPNGVTLVNPDSERPGTMISIGITATSNASVGSFPVYITASYPLEGSQTIERTARLMVTVTDFDLTVSPSTMSLVAGSEGQFTITVTTSDGFAAPISVAVTDVPQGAKIALSSGNGSSLLSVPGTVSLAIQTLGVRQGTYTITITVKASLHEGGYIIHSQRIQVTVR